MALSVAVRRETGDLNEDIRRALSSIGTDGRGCLAGRRVLVKANFNSPHRRPATTAPDFLAALLRVLREAGAGAITIGDSCGLRWAPADRVFSALGVPELAARTGAALVNFDNGPWRELAVGGGLFPVVRVAQAVFEADVVVYACCIKTHRAAGFSISLKHAVGFLPPDQRNAVHHGDIARRIAEINLAVRPDLVFLDARRCFAAGGPAIGWVRRPGLIMASTDRIALDVEGLKVLGAYPRLNRLRRNPWDEPQIRECAALGIGIGSESEYEVVKA